MPRARSPMTTVLPLLISLTSCATAIHNFPLCAPYPPTPNTPPFEKLGASCDNFLEPFDKRSLTKTQWTALQAEWRKNGWALECTHSQAIAWNKAELEKLCSASKCTKAQADTVAELWGELDRAERLGKRVNEIAAQMASATSDPLRGLEILPELEGEDVPRTSR